MKQLLPIIRRVRRPLIEQGQQTSEPVKLTAETQRRGEEQELVNEVSGEPPETTGGTVAAPLEYMPPNTNNAKPAHNRKTR